MKRIHLFKTRQTNSYKKTMTILVFNNIIISSSGSMSVPDNTDNMHIS